MGAAKTSWENDDQKVTGPGSLLNRGNKREFPRSSLVIRTSALGYTRNPAWRIQS